MQRIFAIAAVGAMLVGMQWAQTKVDVRRQGKGYSFLEPPFSKPVRSGTALPLDCAVGELFFLETAPAGGNLYACHTPGQWAPLGSAGQGYLTIRNDGELVGVRPEANFIPGTGIVTVLSDSGSMVNVQQDVNTAVVMTKSAFQAGGASLCASTATDGLAFSCALQPTLQAYSLGMTLHWKPEMDSAMGNVTLDIDHLGPKPVRQADGVTPIAQGAFRADQMYDLWFDGQGFRAFGLVIPEDYLPAPDLQGGELYYCESSGTVGSAFSCNLSPALQSYTKGMTLHWRPDVNSEGGETTLSVDGLAALPVKLRDGITDPDSGAIKGGQVYGVWHDGTQFRIIEELRADLLARREIQTGVALQCESVGTVGGDYTCSTNPAFDAYSRGMVLHWIPDVSSSGGAISLDVNGIGPASVRAADGVTEPQAGELIGSRMYPVWFDGTGFRVSRSANDSVLKGTQPSCTNDRRGMLWFVPGGTETADQLSVCTKDATGVLAWSQLY